MPKVKFLEISKPSKGSRYAISDIHGCIKTFKALLNEIDLKKKDQLFLVGDLVNRGPQSDLVLDYYIELKNKGYQIFFIRGNHDQMILNSAKKTDGQRKRLLGTLNSLNLLKGGKLRKEYTSVLKDSFHFIKTNDFYLVHAGFNLKADKPFEDIHAMLNIRTFKVKKKKLDGRKVIIGHSPKELSKVLKRIKKGKRKLYIDNGCVNRNTIGQGNLICLNLDSMALTVQPNLDS